ncbi:MAG: DALR anticodon-binding domain-containing protein, partial [Alphaproteobacteria bacterium]
DALLSQKEEIRLAAVLHELAGVSGKALDGADLKSYFTALAALRQPVDAFFDNVTVNSDDQHLRHNRLLLLMALCRCMETVADFSCIEG